MEDLEKSRAAELLRQDRFTTKEDLLAWISNEKKRISDKAVTDRKHSSAFYYAYTKMLDRFYKKVDGTVLFKRLEDFWYYSIDVSSYGACLALEYTQKCWLDDSGHLVCQTGQTLRLLFVPGRLLTVEEYADEYNVGAGTVRQWIRRGKIRTARKSGKEWLIPELSELPGRGYQSAVYQYNGSLSNLPEEYNYLLGYTTVIINQNHKDKSLYNVTVAAGGKESINLQMDTKEREKLEVFLIANPEVTYVDGPMDGLNVSISAKTYVNDWLV